jgi:hypothetical protein
MGDGFGFSILSIIIPESASARSSLFRSPANGYRVYWMRSRTLDTSIGSSTLLALNATLITGDTTTSTFAHATHWASGHRVSMQKRWPNMMNLSQLHWTELRGKVIISNEEMGRRTRSRQQ